MHLITIILYLICSFSGAVNFCETVVHRVYYTRVFQKYRNVNDLIRCFRVSNPSVYNVFKIHIIQSIQCEHDYE